MIIWRGWGVLTILIAGASIGLGVLIAPNPGLRGLFAGLTTIAGGVGTWFLGNWFNHKRAGTQLDQWHAKRREEIAALVRGGHYSAVPDPQRPGQMADPWAVGEYVLQQEAGQAKAALSNQHSLFFVPMQYWGFVLAALGIFFAIANPFT